MGNDAWQCGQVVLKIVTAQGLPRSEPVNIDLPPGKLILREGVFITWAVNPAAELNNNPRRVIVYLLAFFAVATPGFLRESSMSLRKFCSRCTKSRPKIKSPPVYCAVI